MTRTRPAVLTNRLKSDNFRAFYRIHLFNLLGVQHMRKSIHLIFLISVFLINTGSLNAADLKNGFFDIQWKTNLSQTAGFKKVGENLNVSYFINPERVFTIDKIRIPDVVYGSYADQFFAVYIKIDTIEVFAQLIDAYPESDEVSNAHFWSGEILEDAGSAEGWILRCRHGSR